MGKKKMSGNREPRKPKKEKLPITAEGTVGSVLNGDKPTSRSAK